jgi:hypothetical protein
MNATLASSSPNIIQFPAAADRPSFAVASKAWLRSVTGHHHVTAGEARLGAALYQWFNVEHYETTGELKAWRGWEGLMADSSLSKMGVRNGIEKFERLGLLKVDRGGYDPSTKRRTGNIYRVPPTYMTNANGASCAHDRPRYTTKVNDQGKQNRQDSVNRLGDKDSAIETKSKKKDLSLPSGPRGPEAKRRRNKQEQGSSAPSTDAPALLRRTAREVARGTPRNGRDWRWQDAERVAADEANLERYRRRAAAATGVSS